MFGTYTFEYIPDSAQEGAGDGLSVRFTFPGDTDLPKMLAYFEAFLRANGYLLPDRSRLAVTEESDAE